MTLETVARYLDSCGDTVWATRAGHTVEEIRGWQPDVIVGQQWATEEASRWATMLGRPFVMFVHGPGQLEHFRPQCDLVVFNSAHQLESAPRALGNTPATVLHPPVFRADYETPRTGACITFVGTGPAEGNGDCCCGRACDASGAVPVRDGRRPRDLPANVEVMRRTADMREVYGRTRLLVVPSSHESYGRVAVEGAMSGIPSVVADLPGIREATCGLATFVSAGASWPDAVPTRSTPTTSATPTRSVLPLSGFRHLSSRTCATDCAPSPRPGGAGRR